MMPLSKTYLPQHQNREIFPGDTFDLLPKDQLVVIELLTCNRRSRPGGGESHGQP